MATKVAKELKSKKEQRVAFNNLKGFMLNPFIQKSTVPEFQYLKYKKGSPKKKVTLINSQYRFIYADIDIWPSEVRLPIAFFC